MIFFCRDLLSKDPTAKLDIKGKSSLYWVVFMASFHYLIKLRMLYTIQLFLYLLHYHPGNATHREEIGLKTRGEGERKESNFACNSFRGVGVGPVRDEGSITNV
jgi:hypothetical protein